MFVDTSVWSLAFRRDLPETLPEVDALRQAIRTGRALYSTGLVLQELLQGFAGPRDSEAVIARVGALPFVNPRRRDHIDAAALRNACRRGGVQIGTVDALLAQLCIAHDLVLLTTDRDFHRIAELHPLAVWLPAGKQGG